MINTAGLEARSTEDWECVPGWLEGICLRTVGEPNSRDPGAASLSGPQEKLCLPTLNHLGILNLCRHHQSIRRFLQISESCSFPPHNAPGNHNQLQLELAFRVEPGCHLSPGQISHVSRCLVSEDPRIMQFERPVKSIYLDHPVIELTRKQAHEGVVTVPVTERSGTRTPDP